VLGQICRETGSCDPGAAARSELLVTLHDDDGERLLGFDNAHAIREGSGPGARTRIEYDHKHSGQQVRFYLYANAATLLADFWTEVEAILQKRSNLP
jgi:hypothetical protein